MIKKSTITKPDILGGYQIIGGLFGLGLTIVMATKLGPINIFIILLLLFAFVLYGYSIFCGILILSNPIKGLKYSRINQFLQIFNFYISGYGFQYISGIFISLGIDLTNSFNLKFNLGTSTWQIAFNQDSEVSILNINFVALFILIFIDRQIKKIHSQELNKVLIEIGQNVETHDHSS